MRALECNASGFISVDFFSFTHDFTSNVSRKKLFFSLSASLIGCKSNIYISNHLREFDEFSVCVFPSDLMLAAGEREQKVHESLMTRRHDVRDTSIKFQR